MPKISICNNQIRQINGICFSSINAEGDELELPDLDNGVYLLEIKQKDTRKAIKVKIKQR